MRNPKIQEKLSDQEGNLRLLSASPSMGIYGPLLDQNECSVSVAMAVRWYEAGKSSRTRNNIAGVGKCNP